MRTTVNSHPRFLGQITPDALPARIHVIGGPGSGKTTISKALAQSLDVSVFELDEVAGAGAAPAFRMERPLDERLAEVEQIATLPGWVTEGSFLWWTDRLLDAADVIIWLDIPWHIAARRVISRHIREYGADILRAVDWRERLRVIRYPHLRHLVSFLLYTRNYYLRPEQADPPGQRDLDSGWAITRAETLRQLAPFSSKVIHCTTPAQVSRLQERIIRLRTAQPVGRVQHNATERS